MLSQASCVENDERNEHDPYRRAEQEMFHVSRENTQVTVDSFAEFFIGTPDPVS